MTRLLLLATLATCTPATASQSVSVDDGDTLTVGGVRWRLWGGDAFELDQECGSTPCGLYARDHLAEAIQGRQVVCTVAGPPSYGRQVGRCLADHVDLAAEQVLSGWALDWARYSGGAYRSLEHDARNDRRGAWAERFEPPWEWRRQHAR